MTLRLRGAITAAPLLLLSLAAIAPPAAATPTTVISSAGPLEDIWIGEDLSCQVKHVNDAAYQFYPPSTIPGDCGTFLAVGATLYAPDFANHGGTATGSLGMYTPFTPVSQSGVTGSGTAGSPYEINTVAAAGGIQLDEVDRYVVGDDFYETEVTLTNTGATTLAGVFYRAGDCYLGGSDHGYGAVGITAAGSIACTQNPNNVPAGRFEEFIPVTAGSTYYHEGYATVWAWIGGKTPFPDTCQCTTFLDNGAGLSWTWTLGPGASTTFVNRLRFDVPPVDPPPPPPPPIPQTVHCESHALLVREVDSLGNSVEQAFASSMASTSTLPGSPTAPVAAPAPPLAPASHADAEEVGATYSNGMFGPISVDARGLFSQCDVAAYENGTTSLAHGYARAGVADLTVRVGTARLHLELLDHELDVRATSAATGATWACDLAEAVVNANKVVAVCQPPPVAPLFGSPCFNVDVLTPYAQGPIINGFGEWEYQGAVLTILIGIGGSCTTAGAFLEIHVGYTRVSANGGPAAAPAYVPNTGCLVAALCT